MNGFTGQGADNGSGDPFSKFWMDMMSKMGTGFAPAAVPTQDETAKRMRQAFFDAWAGHCDEVMHSPMFLDMMKKSMDGALAFKQEMNQFLTKALHDQQMPARSDTDSILLVLRSMEDRVIDRLNKLSERVERLESSDAGETVDGTSPAASKRRPKGVVK